MGMCRCQVPLLLLVQSNAAWGGTSAWRTWCTSSAGPAKHQLQEQARFTRQKLALVTAKSAHIRNLRVVKKKLLQKLKLTRRMSSWPVVFSRPRRGYWSRPAPPPSSSCCLRPPAWRGRFFMCEATTNLAREGSVDSTRLLVVDPG